jgi:hypothetical protein
MDYVKETCSWWSFWCSEKVKKKKLGTPIQFSKIVSLTLSYGSQEYCLARQSAAPPTAVAQEQFKTESTTIPFNCLAGGCEGYIEKLPEDACGPGWSPNGPLVTLCGREAGFCQTPNCRPCVPGKGFFQSQACKKDGGGAKVFAVWAYNLDSSTCYVGNNRATQQYTTYKWDGCPGLDPNDWERFGLYTSETLAGEQRPRELDDQDSSTPVDAVCTEVGGSRVLTNQPPDSDRFVVSATASANVGRPHVGVGVGMMGGLGAACVVGLGWSRKKMRTTSKKGEQQGEA